MSATRIAPALVAAAVALAGTLALARAGDPIPPPPAPATRLVTLHAGDPVSHTLDLAQGDFGARIEGTRLLESPAHLDYGNYADDAFTFALDEDDRAVVVDLGHWGDLAKAYEFPEADGGGIGFATISYSAEESDFRIARRVPKDGFQNLREGRALLATVAGDHRVAVHPVPGHVYLVRIQDRLRKRPAVHAKLLVVSHVPGDHVTFRWARIPGL
jgi:hypothetical protein